MRKIVITTLPIKCNQDDVFKMAQNDRALINAICSTAKEFRKEDTEVFGRKNNIIATEKGYFLALYEDELEQVDETEKEEKPFTGEDGRLKVKLTDADNVEHVKDVAEMVAEVFVPNPFGHKFVKFKDDNPKNCNKSNLYWSDTK